MWQNLLIVIASYHNQWLVAEHLFSLPRCWLADDMQLLLAYIALSESSNGWRKMITNEILTTFSVLLDIFQSHYVIKTGLP